MSNDRPPLSREHVQKRFLILVVIAITIWFGVMIEGMLMTLLMAAILSALSYPLYARLTLLYRGKRGLASVTTVIGVILLLIVPLAAFLGIVTGQAIEVTRSIGPKISDFLANPASVDRFFAWIPYGDQIVPYKGEILTRLGQIAQSIGGFLLQSVAAFTAGTVLFLFQLFVMLYAMFFFNIYGKGILERIMYYMPLPRDEQELLFAKFVSVTRATLKGTLIIGILQGAMAGLAFAIIGIEGAAFWGTVMAVLSIIPAVGSGLVWFPAVLWLFAIGRTVAAIALLIWCALVVGSADNFLRPRLVGRDTQMPDLLILLGTIGGLTMFGALGMIIGPIIAALFVTVWEIYGEVFGYLLKDKEAEA